MNHISATSYCVIMPAILQFLAFIGAFQLSARETVLDNISHVETDMVTQVEALPPLCDSIELKKEFIDIGGTKIYCETEGKGIPVVLINGGPGGTHHYFHPWFSEASKYSKIIYYDQRGCGKSDFSSDAKGYSVEQAVRDLDRLRQKLGIDQWIVCGYSYGGAIAQLYATEYPENLRAMVLISSVPMFKNRAFKGSRQYDFISPEEQQKIREIKQSYLQKKINFTQFLYNKALNGDWKRQLYHKPTHEEMVRAARYEWVNDRNFNQIVSRTVKRYDLRHVFDTFPIPTLICEGKWDLTWKPEKRAIFRGNHPNAQYQLFHHSGHNIFADESRLFFSELRDFIEGIEPTSIEAIRQWNKHADSILRPQKDLFRREEEFHQMIKQNGVDGAVEYYQKWKRENDGRLFTESSMNRWAYGFLSKQETESAIKLFILNTQEYPNSGNVFDSLAEAYQANHEPQKAIANYQKSLALNPENDHAKKMIEELLASDGQS